MILVGYSISKVLIGVLFVTLALLIVAIAYRKLLKYLGKGNPVAKDYCVLYSVEKNPASGEVEIYFTTDNPREVSIELLDSNFSLIKVLKADSFGEGGHIVRFESKEFENGNYFYCLRSDNQKTVKKLTILN